MVEFNTVLLHTGDAIYNHTVRVVGRLAGLYACNVSNSKPSFVSTSMLIEGNISHRQILWCSVLIRKTISLSLPDPPNAPTNLKLVEGAQRTIIVSWSAPTGGGATLTGYSVCYWQFGGSETCLDVPAGDTAVTTATLNFGLYHFIVEANSIYLPSVPDGPEYFLLGMIIHMYMYMYTTCTCIYMNNHLYRAHAPQCTWERIRKKKKERSTPQHHPPTHNSLNGLESIMFTNSPNDLEIIRAWVEIKLKL